VLRIILMCIAWQFVFAGSAGASIIYAYTGNPIDQVSPSNASQLGNHMTLTLEFASVLPANASNLSVCPSGCSATVLTFDAHGGGPIEASTANGGHMAPTGQVSTDALGQIIDWSMTFSFLSAAVVFSSTALSEPDLAKPVFDVGEVQNTHWGASTVGSWSPLAIPVSSPGTLSLLLIGAVAAFLARAKMSARR
jgi:hypothetical protein